MSYKKPTDNEFEWEGEGSSKTYRGAMVVELPQQ